MVDTFIANANVDDLRSIVRSLLATNNPGLSASFTHAARSRLHQTASKTSVNTYALFTLHSQTTSAAPTQHLHDVLVRARTLYGAGMGFASLKVLTSVIRASLELQWEDDSDLSNLFAFIDADIGQAIQSSKEEIEGGRVSDWGIAHEIVDDLRGVVKESKKAVQVWGGEFPFERTASSLEYWKI
ncbi:hypothetical protein J132_11292 [Termitomyces sp. J132]|nr:hypothetical protein J132_11292 [Termitomyces sp. J132]